MGAGDVGVLLGSALAMAILAFCIAWLICRIFNRDELASLSLGYMIAVPVAAVLYMYGKGDGNTAFFAVGFYQYGCAGLFAFALSIIFELDDRLSKSKKSRGK